MAMARKIRMNYVVTLCLKAVTKAAHDEDQATGGHHHHGARSLGAHASCDMIPLVAFALMLERGPASSHSKHDKAAVAAILRERQKHLIADEAVASKLRTVVGETTGYVKSYVTKREIVPREVRTAMKTLVSRTFRSVKVVATEDLTVGSAFYKYAVSALVHDTLVSPGARSVARAAGVDWLIPQVAYGIGGSYGVPHSEYVLGAREDLAIYAAPPVTDKVALVMDCLGKFEHPIPSLAPPPASPSAYPNYSAVMSVLKELERGAGAEGPPGHDVVVCVPLHEVDVSTARQLAASMKEETKFRSVAVDIEPVTRHTATLVLHVAT